MVYEKPNIYHFLQRYFSDRQGLGMEAVIILDTSAIIGLETVSQQQYGCNHAHEFIDALRNTSPREVKFIVPTGVKEETKNHTLYHHLNGRPEISFLTLKRILELPEESKLQHFIDAHEERVDTAHYFLRLMYLFKMEGKKKDCDPISRNDWEIIDMAIAAGIYSEVQFERNKLCNPTKPFEGCYKVAVLSGDKHIYWTLDKSAEEPEGVGLDNFIKPVNINNYSLNRG